MEFILKLQKYKRKIILFCFDFLSFSFFNALCYLCSLWIPFENFVDGSVYFLNSILLGVAIHACRFLLGSYQTVWRYTSTKANALLILADFLGALLTLCVSLLTGHKEDLWHIAIVASLNALFTLFARFVYHLKYRQLRELEQAKKKHVCVIGAGQLGAVLVNELLQNQSTSYYPVCFIDTDEEKIGNRVSNLPVYSKKEMDMVFSQYRIQDVIVAINNPSQTVLDEYYRELLECNVKLHIYETPIQNIDGVQKQVIRDFKIEDLLFRKPLDVGNQEAFQFYRDKVILVTGGGGSIGSEICRQLATCHPKKLIIFDIYENNAYSIEQELISHYGIDFPLAIEIGSVRDPKRLEMVFEYYRPQIVFHAAAHKHVPLMEHSSCEAIKNNVFGTYNTANLAEQYGVQKFILISTDKAVNPTNIMGASKRLCEMVIQSRQDSKTSFACVRFGNVLGSNGSVIPLFKKQIEEGGPVTITDKRIIRYFMTIPEASQLVMQAGAMAKKGELFVLDMGKPIKIYDLACQMILLSGLKPNIDIEIKEIGLRSGEKLYEELLIKTESLSKTDSDLIFVEKDTPKTREEMDAIIKELQEAVDAFMTVDSHVIHDVIQKILPTYHRPEDLNQSAEESDEMKQAQ